jgi:hypothetical protein
MAGVASRPALSRRIAILLAAFVINIVISGLMGARAALPPNGPSIVDLELAMSPGVFTQIVHFWGDHRYGGDFWVVPAIRGSIRIDYVFAIAYAFLISYLYWSLCQTGTVPLRRTIVAAPWVAAACDWIENTLLLAMLERPAPPTATVVKAMAAAAIVKFALLAIAGGFTIAALLAGDRGRVIRTARYSVISLLIGTLPIIALGQGRDLLLGLSDPSAGRHQSWFIAWTVVWAFSVWYWSRILLDADAPRTPSKLYEEWASWLPRIAGFLTLFVPGMAFLLVAGDALPATRSRLHLMAGWCVGLSLLFFAYVVFRKRIPFFGGKTAEGYALKEVSTPSAIVFALSGALSAGMLFYLTVDALDAGHRFGAVAILSIVAANTVFFGAVAVFVTRARRWPVELTAFACAAVFSVWNDNHDVRLTAPPSPRPDMSAAFASWVARAPAKPGQPVPVIVAASEGGGIRAAYWTSLVLHHLADVPEVQFPQRLFAISSVSGGSFGAAVYAGLRRDPTGPPGRTQIAKDILQEQFLAPMVAKAVSGDLLQWFLPFPVRAFDRSGAMEEAFARAYREHVGNGSMSLPFAALRPPESTEVPVLLLNSTSVELGRRIVASPYPWSRTDLAADERDPIDFHALTGRDVLTSTAVHNTARFPYISAAGHLRASGGQSLGHLVDGGYFENTGADTLIDLLRYLRTAASPLDVRFIVIVVANTPPGEHATDPTRIPWREAESLGELFSPLRALLQTRTARGDLALRRLSEAVEPGDFIELRVCSDSRLREAPLGWQLSKEMIGVLDANLSQECFTRQVARLRDAIAR